MQETPPISVAAEEKNEVTDDTFTALNNLKIHALNSKKLFENCLSMQLLELVTLSLSDIFPSAYVEYQPTRLQSTGRKSQG